MGNKSLSCQRRSLFSRPRGRNSANLSASTASTCGVGDRLRPKPTRAALVAWPVFIGLLAVAILIVQLIFGLTDEFPDLVDEADARFCSVFSKTEPDTKALQAAIEQYTSCLKLRGSDKWCLMQRAILHFHANRIPEAISDLQQLTNRHPDYASVNQLLALACQEMGDPSKSREYRSLAQRIYPTRSEDLFWLGHTTCFILRDKELAGYYWTACLLRTPDQFHTFGPRDAAMNVSRQTYYVHFLSRRFYAKNCLDVEASSTRAGFPPACQQTISSPHGE